MLNNLLSSVLQSALKHIESNKLHMQEAARHTTAAMSDNKNSEMHLSRANKSLSMASWHTEQYVKDLAILNQNVPSTEKQILGQKINK